MSGRVLGLRVTMVTHYWEPHIGGIETVARQQAHGLAARGVDVEVHTTRIPSDAPAVSAAPAGEDRGGVRVTRHRAIDPLAASLQVPVPFPTPKMASAVVEAARRSDVVIAHGHTYPTSVIAARAARRTGRPFVLVQHSPWIAYGGPLDLIERVADLTLGRAVIGAADRIVCVSEYTAEYVRSIVPAADTVVVHNRVDARFRPARATVSSGRAIPTLLFVGRLVGRNGWSVLVEAWRRSGLADRAELHIVGSGPDERAICAAVDGFDGVRLIGHVPDEGLADRYRSADVVVVPTVTGEGFGLVAAEALACGTPVVASAQGGLAEVVCDGVDGLLVPAGNADALAAAMRRVIDDVALRSSLTAGALAREHGDPSGSDAAIDALLDILLAQVDRRRSAVAIGARTGSS